MSVVCCQVGVCCECCVLSDKRSVVSVVCQIEVCCECCVLCVR